MQRRHQIWLLKCSLTARCITNIAISFVPCSQICVRFALLHRLGVVATLGLTASTRTYTSSSTTTTTS